MGRQELIQQIETELRGQSPETRSNQSISDTLCQHCGSTIVSDDTHGDYVVHRIPAHGTDDMRTAFYCGPTCFQDAMDDLFDV
jgi:hypothetical protein